MSSCTCPCPECGPKSDPSVVEHLRGAVDEWQGIANERGQRWLDLADENTKLTDKIADLTRQRDDARDIAIRCGAWHSGAGTDFEAHLGEPLGMPLVDPDGRLFGGGA